MRVDNVNDKFFIEFNKNILNEKEMIELVEYLKTKEIIYKSELQKKDIERLDNELKQNWWNKNKDVILGKIYDSCR
jgi:galactokinase/mevalonate kinase-like predicted kinase